ncbi:MAG: hypothetical protein RLZZ423_142 [Cyanobacteriota bacterium]
MGHQLGGLAALRPGLGCARRIGWIQQQHQGGGQLFGGAALRLALQRMPLAFVDAQQPVQLTGLLLGLLRPALGGGGTVAVSAVAIEAAGWHWTAAAAPGHPGAMQQRPRSPYTPIRWLHQLAGLMAQVARAERLSAADDSLQARRLRQRMALAQRLLDPLPAPLQPRGWQEQWLWTALRWGGIGLLLALWLHR